MTVNHGGSIGNNFFTTHPKRKKVEGSDVREKKVRSGFLRTSRANGFEKPRKDRIYGLADLPDGLRENFLENLIVAHSHRIAHLTSSDLKTAFKSLFGVIIVPDKIVHNGEPAINAFLSGRKTPYTITVRETIAALS